MSGLAEHLGLGAGSKAEPEERTKQSLRFKGTKTDRPRRVTLPDSALVSLANHRKRQDEFPVIRNHLRRPSIIREQARGTGSPPNCFGLFHKASPNPCVSSHMAQALAPSPWEEPKDAIFPFWSPDSRWVAFGQERKLKKIDIQGGPPVAITDLPGAFRGGSWSPAGVIVFGANADGAVR